jgi:putative mRNA 3-end processing factor
MLVMTSQGLYCPLGNFHIDPKGKVEHAVVTHAHSDHARRGAQNYYCELSGVELLKTRLGKNLKVDPHAYGEVFELNGVRLSFHSAGHILGSSQVRIESGGEVWVVSGDYKRDYDPTCEPFEVVKCDVFVTEATFGTPSYVWPKGKDLGKEIFDWWEGNRDQGINSVLFAYSLGKAQRVLGLLEPYATRPVYCHAAASALNACYRAQGIQLAPTRCLSEVTETEALRGELFLVPSAFLNGPQAHLLGENYETAFASGWMSKGSSPFGSSYDKGFTLSDHADWSDLVRTVQDTGARKIYVQHRGKGALVRHLKSLGLQAFPEEDLVPRNPSQLQLF